MFPRRSVLLSGAMLLAVALGAPSGAALAQDKKLRVVTTFTVIQDIAQNVAGDGC